MYKFCRFCGAPLKPTVNFCGHCGKAMDVPGRQEISQAFPAVQTTTQVPVPEKKGQSYNKGKIGRGKLIFLGAACLAIVITLVVVVPKLFKTFENSVAVESIMGQPCSGRAITITGRNFGCYDAEKCRVTIDGKDTPIVSWCENKVIAIVPAGISGGKNEVLLSNPPAFNKISSKKEFMEHKEEQLANVTLSPTEDNYIEGDGFSLIVPAESISEETNIIIDKYDAPAVDDNPYYSVVDEFEISGSDGKHIFFDSPVFFGLSVKDKEEALQTSFQIFDEFEGLWVKAESIYVEEEGKLYIVTNHFSGLRRCVSFLYQESKKRVGEAIDKNIEAGKKGVDYVYKAKKTVDDFVVRLEEEAWVAIKDATVEEFVGIWDADKNIVVYYKVSDADKDPALPDLAREMTAAFSVAFNEYKGLFGEANVPPTTRTAYLTEAGNIYDMPDPIKVYLDPSCKEAVTKSATTGNIIMPTKYREGDLASTCAHELFHAVQYHQLGLKQLYMGTTGLKDILDNRFTGNDAEVYRFFANNKWFLEASAEYAGRFIGTNEGVDAPLHPRIDASKPYYFYNGVQEYGVSSFLDYILSARQPEADSRGEAFREMWNTVTANYSMLLSINTAFDEYVHNKLDESANDAYLDFWREVFTRSYMPKVDNIAGGLTDVNTLNNTQISSFVRISEGGTGIVRYNFQPLYMLTIPTARTRTFWFEAPEKLNGDIYRLDGLDMDDRIMWDSQVGTVNYSGTGLRDVLLQYNAGDTFGLIAIFHNAALGDLAEKITISSTALEWVNQKEIEEKLKNTTLSQKDELEFMPTLPRQKPGEPPYKAIVILNEDNDYKTEIDNVQDAKPFKVGAPMQELPPGKISINIKILKEETLIHEYQSGEPGIGVSILGPQAQTIEVGSDQLPFSHLLTAKASLEGKYIFEWVLDNGVVVRDIADKEFSVIADYVEFKEYKPYVVLYDLNDNKLATAKISLTIREKEKNKGVTTNRMDGKWIAYERGYGGGSNDPVELNITLIINNGQFTMSKSAGDIEPWSGGGFIEEFVQPTFTLLKLVPDTGNEMDDYYFAEYFGLEHKGLYLEYSESNDELVVGTTGSKLIFKRE